MPPDEAEIRHVSDTALMVAACRAMETARPDGLVRDPFAEELAGARGMAIARALGRLEMMCFGMGVRSRFLDELVAGTVDSGKVSVVLSLGCGLDTRPWRLDLPPGLRWIEVDFPGMLDYKGAIMARHAPKCRLERLAADLNDPAQRRAVLAATGGAGAMMITEGLLQYLPAGTIEALAAEPPPSIRYWLLELASSAMARRVRMDANPSIEKVRAPDHLRGEQMLEILDRNGWTSARHRSYITDAWAVAGDRIRAINPTQFAPEQEAPLTADDPSGVHLFARK